MNPVEMYSELIIVPLEKEVKKLRKKVNNKKISFTKDLDKKHLEKMEKLLLYYYNRFAIFLNKEINNENI